LVLDVFQYLAKNRKVEILIGVGNLISVEAFQLHQFLQVTMRNRFHTRLRDLQCIQLARKFALFQYLQQAAFASSYIDYAAKWTRSYDRLDVRERIQGRDRSLGRDFVSAVVVLVQSTIALAQQV